MRIWVLAAAWLCCGGILGCSKAPENGGSAASASALPASPAMPALPSAAQPRLQTLKVWVGAEELVAELALTDTQRMTGMMYRTNMADSEAMLFVFPVAHRTSFWMKNTPLPLSAAYVAPDGTILEIHDLKPYDTNSVPAGSGRVQYVLETTQGWFQRKNIGPGAVLRTERGSLQETFFRR